MPILMSESTTVLAAPLLERKVQRARRGLLIYFAVLIPLSAFFEGLLIAHHTASWLFIPLMWTPALSSLVARLVLHEGIRDISFRLGGRRGLFGLLVAFLLPL